MKKPFLLLYAVLIASTGVIAQETETPTASAGVDMQKTERKFNFVFRQSAGIFIGHPSKGVNATLNIQLQSKKLFGFGIDLSNGIYRSPEFNAHPTASEISNYDPTTDGPIPEVIVNGTDKDKFWGISPYISKGFDINSWFSFELQGGPSIALIKKRTYIYNYSGPSGSFGGFSFGSSGPFVSAGSSGETETTFGGYLRAYGSFKLGSVFSIEVSPFANINNIENEFGLQLGIGFKF